MLGFILSKLNLLIMVTAIFAIVTYFTFFVGQSVVDRKAEQLLVRFTEDTRSTIINPNSCNRTTISIPPYIYSVGAESGNRVYFKVRVSKIPPNANDPAKLIYALTEKESGRIMAAQTYPLQAQIRLYEYNPSNNSLVEQTADSVEVDPQSVPPTDSLIVVKETFQGQTSLFVVPCASSATEQSFCASNFSKLVTKIKTERGAGGVFNCEPPPI